MQQRTCSITGCEHPHEARGWCATHYARWRRSGDPLYLTPYQVLRLNNIETRFLAKTASLPSGCWQWTANAEKAGYGLFKVNGDNVRAHRWAYEHWVGAIPTGQQLDHYRFPQDGCIGPACVNPEHLRPASPRENSLRSDSFASEHAAKTHCPQGHPYAGDNLRIKSSGARVCRTCDRSAMRARYYRRKPRS